MFEYESNYFNLQFTSNRFNNRLGRWWLIKQRFSYKHVEMIPTTISDTLLQ